MESHRIRTAMMSMETRIIAFQKTREQRFQKTREQRYIPCLWKEEVFHPYP